MRFLNRFNETYEISEEDVLDVKDIFQEYADKYFLTKIPNMSKLDRKESSYSIYEDEKYTIVIEVYFQVNNASQNGSQFEDDLDDFTSTLNKNGYRMNYIGQLKYYKIFISYDRPWVKSI